MNKSNAQLKIYKTQKGRFAVRPKNWSCELHDGLISDDIKHTAVFRKKKDAEEYIQMKRERAVISSEDLDRIYHERNQRYLHYLDHVGMYEHWVETAPGEIKVLIDAIADYTRIIESHCQEKDDPIIKITWQVQMKRIDKIRKKLERP